METTDHKVPVCTAAKQLPKTGLSSDDNGLVRSLWQSTPLPSYISSTTPFSSSLSYLRDLLFPLTGHTQNDHHHHPQQQQQQRCPDHISDTDYLNAQNKSHPSLPTSSDVVVVGGGIHALIYAIHATLRSSPSSSTHITVLEKLPSPGYKIGESTLTTFGVWLRSVGLGTALLWRLFGPKDGLAFYYLGHDGEEEEEDYSDFCANGPAGDFVATLQIERRVSELLLTLFAQRLGVCVLHGHAVDIEGTRLPSVPGGVGDGRGTGDDGSDSAGKGRVEVLVDEKGPRTKGENTKKKRMAVETQLVVDATGRFRRFASKAARTERGFDSGGRGFNTDAYWAYFEMVGDEADMPFAHYESCHTNHICLAEGWAWIIRLPSWEGSPLPNLIDMINHLLDLNEANTPADAYPSSRELADKFNLRLRWITSIGYALRDDLVWPTDLDLAGSCEAARKFRHMTARYPRMQALMDRHTLIPDPYPGAGGTWFVRKRMAYRSPAVTDGVGWAAVGDATGFTSPLFSPGINCNMGTAVFLAERTGEFLAAAAGSETRRGVLEGYARYCEGRMADLQRMNVFNYLTMRSPRTGTLGPLWQYLCGTGNDKWQRIKDFAHIDTVAELVTTWEWGANRPEYMAFAERAIALLQDQDRSSTTCSPPSKDVVDEVLALSETMLREAVATGRYRNRWAGLMRYYDDQLRFDADKVARDVLAVRCVGCANWRVLTGEARRCPACGCVNEVVAIRRYN